MNKMNKAISILFCLVLSGCMCSSPEIHEDVPNVHKESDQQWREGTIHLWTGGGITGDVRWVPDRKSYELRSKRVKPEIQLWVEENEVAWIALANGTIWKDYQTKKDQNKELKAKGKPAP